MDYPPISDTIERLYRAFACEPRPSHLDTSPLYDGDAIYLAVTSKPLRWLSSDDIGPYSGHALSTCGDESDYRHFLPRILELSLDHPPWVGLEPAIVAAKLIHGGWRSWIPAQTEAVAAFVSDAFAFSLRAPRIGAAIPEKWLCVILLLGLDCDACLALWRADRTPIAALKLADFVCDWASCKIGRIPKPPFWSDVPTDLYENVRSWLMSADTAAQLVDAVDRLDPDDVPDIEWAIATLWP